jgi:hypothetical protein
MSAAKQTAADPRRMRRKLARHPGAACGRRADVRCLIANRVASRFIGMYLPVQRFSSPGRSAWRGSRSPRLAAEPTRPDIRRHLPLPAQNTLAVGAT